MPRSYKSAGEEKPKHPLLEALEDCKYLHVRINAIRQKISGMQDSKDEEIYFYASMELLHVDNYVRRIKDKIKTYTQDEGIR